jgi:hypothetical protein
VQREEPADVASDGVPVPPWLRFDHDGGGLGVVRRSIVLVHLELPVIRFWTSYVPLNRNVG